jgi:hypothetical protein
VSEHRRALVDRRTNVGQSDNAPRILHDSSQAGSDAIFALQRAVGNKTVSALLRERLSVGRANDYLQRQTVPQPGTARAPAGTAGSHRGRPYVVYENEIRVGGTPAWCNNNPGNMEFGPFTQGHGAIGRAGRWAIFPDEDTGFNAILDRLQSGSYEHRTIREAIHAWAPATDRNDPVAYVAFVRRLTGLDPSLRLDSLPGEGLEAVANAIRTVEGSSPGEIVTCSPQPPTWAARLLGCN